MGKELVASSFKKNILQLNNECNVESTDQIAFLSLTDCFYHDTRLFHKVCSVHVFHSWSLLWGQQQTSWLGSTLLVPLYDRSSRKKLERDYYTSCWMSTSVQKEDFDAFWPRSMEDLNKRYELGFTATFHHQHGSFCYIHLPNAFTL